MNITQTTNSTTIAEVQKKAPGGIVLASCSWVLNQLAEQCIDRDRNGLRIILEKSTAITRTAFATSCPELLMFIQRTPISPIFLSLKTTFLMLDCLIALVDGAAQGPNRPKSPRSVAHMCRYGETPCSNRFHRLFPTCVRV